MMRSGQDGLIATSARTASRGRLHRPSTVAEILTILAGEARTPVLVSGGTDLCAQFNEGLSTSDLIAIDRVGELRGVTLDRNTLRIGAATTHETGMFDPTLRRVLPGLADAWGQVANERVRGWATIGGNLMALRPRYELSVMLTAIDALLVFVDAAGEPFTRMPADLWRDGTPERALLHHVAIPIRDGATFFYDRSHRPAVTLALYRDASVALAAVATEMLPPVALPVLPGPPDRAAQVAFAAIPSGFADAASSHWYLRRAGTVLLRRALEANDVSL